MKHLHIPTYYEALSEIVGNENLKGGLTDGPMSEIGFAEGISKPTEEAIQSKLAELQAAFDAKAYARNREAEYPPWADQLDYIFHNGFDKWKADIVQPIKDKYPKLE